MSVKLVTSVVPKLDEDVYDAEIDSVDETVSKFDEKQQYRITFKIASEEPEFDGVKIAAWVNRMVDSDGTDVITLKSKLYQLLVALFGADAIEEGLDIDVNTETLRGRKLRLNIVNKAPQSGGDPRPTVSAFLAAKRGKKAA